MYSPKIIQQNLKKAEKKLKFTPTYHSVDEVSAFNEYMAALVDKKSGKLLRALSESDKKWIRNERLLCKLDFKYWLTRYHYIFSSVNNDYVRMNPNVAQNIMIDLFAECEEKQMPIRLQNLKSRRLGITTL